MNCDFCTHAHPQKERVALLLEGTTNERTNERSIDPFLLGSNVRTTAICLFWSEELKKCATKKDIAQKKIHGPKPRGERWNSIELHGTVI